MKAVLVLGIVALAFAGISFGVSRSFDPATANELVAMREAQVRSVTAEMATLQAQGQLPGDSEYDKKARQLQVVSSSLADAHQLVADKAESRSLWKTIAVIAGGVGLVLLGVALSKRRRVPQPALAA